MVVEASLPRWQQLGYAQSELEQAIAAVHAAFLRDIDRHRVVDLAFIGNTGPHYDWSPAMVIDIDVCVLVAVPDAEVGRWLLALGRSLGAELAPMRVDFELKVTKGPYKPDAAPLVRPVAVAHVSLFTELTYARASPSLRWSWRKYRCIKVPDRLRRLAPPAFTTGDVHAMVAKKLACIERGRVEFVEKHLPTLREERLCYSAASHHFREYCLNAAALAARHHGRALSAMEADSLGNEEYADWYFENLFASQEYLQLMRIKSRARQHGCAAPVRESSQQYLRDLLRRLEQDGS